MLRNLALALGVFTLGSSGTLTAAVKIEAMTTVPLVVPANGSASALVVVKLDGPAFSVSLDTGSAVIPFLPFTGDTYTLLVSPSDLLFDYAPDDVNRNFVGFMDVVEVAGAEPSRMSLHMNVDDANIPAVPVVKFKSGMRCGPHVVSLYMPGIDPWASLVNQPVVTTQFYGAFPDDFDFLSIVHGNPSRPENRFHGQVQNKVSGIGDPLFDDTAATGSAGRLLGITHYPLDVLYDMASPFALHELGHQWMNHLDAPPLLFAGLPHWPPSSLARGLMGYNTATNPQGLMFPFELINQGGGNYLLQDAPLLQEYQTLELYLMGLLPPASVVPFVVFDPPDQPILAGTTVTGTLLTVADVIAAQGPRVPAASWPQAFTSGNLVVSRMDPLTDREVAFFDHFAMRAEATTPLAWSQGFGKGEAKPFALATLGRGSLSTSVNCLALIEPPDLPAYQAICEACPPELMGMDLLIRVLPIQDDLLRRRLRTTVARAGKAYARGNLRRAAKELTSFRRQVARSADLFPEPAAATLDTLTVQMAAALEIPLQRAR
jgi:hypothetical protein